MRTADFRDMSLTGIMAVYPAGDVEVFYEGRWQPARIVRQLVDERVKLEVYLCPCRHSVALRPGGIS